MTDDPKQTARKPQMQIVMPDGYYWVLCDGEWYVANWLNGQWWFTGIDLPLSTECIDEVGERVVRRKD